MPDNFTAGYRTLVGSEPLNAYGVAVAPTKALSKASVILKPKIATEEVTPEGAKVASGMSITEDASTATISGSVAFDEIPFFFASAIAGDDGTNTNVALVPTALTPASAKEWGFDIKLDSQDTAQSYTIERSNKGFGQRASGLIISALGMKSENPGKVVWTGEMSGGRLRQTSDGLTPAFTPVQTSPAAIGNPLVLSSKCANIYVSTVSRAALDSDPATAKLSRVKTLGWDIKDRRSPFYEHNCDLDGPALNGEGLKGTAAFTVGANSRTSGYIQQLRKNQPIWIRYEWIGDVIGVGPARYKLVIDIAAFVSSFTEAKGIGANLLGWDISAVFARDDNFYGAGMPGTFSAKVDCTAATILG